MSGEGNEMPKLLAGWLLSSKSYDADSDDETLSSDAECPFDVRYCCVILNVLFTIFPYNGNTLLVWSGLVGLPVQNNFDFF